MQLIEIQIKLLSLFGAHILVRDLLRVQPLNEADARGVSHVRFIAEPMIAPLYKKLDEQQERFPAISLPAAGRCKPKPKVDRLPPKAARLDAAHKRAVFGHDEPHKAHARLFVQITVVKVFRGVPNVRKRLRKLIARGFRVKAVQIVPKIGRTERDERQTLSFDTVGRQNPVVQWDVSSRVKNACLPRLSMSCKTSGASVGTV